MQPTRRVRTHDGLSLAVYDSDDSPDTTRPTVLAVHGYPDDHSVWDALVAALTPQMRVVRYDVRGAGASDRPLSRNGYRIEQLAGDVHSVAATLGTPVHLIAHDWGSIQCWQAAARDDAGHILSFTSMSGPDLGHVNHWLRQRLPRDRTALAQVGKSYYTAMFQLPVLPELAVRSGIVGRSVRRAAGDGIVRRRADMLHGIELYRANLLTRRPIPPARVDVPVLVLAPERDPFVGVPMQTEAPEPFTRDLRTQVVPGGHWVVSRRVETIAAPFTEFVRAHARG